MTDVKKKSTRRAFFLNGGAVLGAGVAATAGAAGLAAPAVAKSGGSAEDREAIRRLHLAFVSQLEDQRYERAADLFSEAQLAAYRQTTSEQKDEVKFSEDGLRAMAMFHCEVELCTPLQDDCTAAQMARLQGMTASRRWESGRFEASYVRTRGQWTMASVSYIRS
jgi:SnoaL-like domain